jgi:hypothetical protein
MAWTGGLRKAAIGAGVLALHALFVAVLIQAGISIPTPASTPERETLLTFVPLPPPKPAEKKPRTPAASSAITITLPRVFAPPPVSNPPSDALQGLGAALGCSASNYDTLSDAQRAACGRGPWRFDSQAHETTSLMIPPSPHRMTPVEIAEHIRRTEDPCLAEKAAHLPFCVYRIIYGDKLP